MSNPEQLLIEVAPSLQEVATSTSGNLIYLTILREFVTQEKLLVYFQNQTQFEDFPDSPHSFASRVLDLIHSPLFKTFFIEEQWPFESNTSWGLNDPMLAVSETLGHTISNLSLGLQHYVRSGRNLLDKYPIPSENEIDNMLISLRDLGNYYMHSRIGYFQRSD